MLDKQIQAAIAYHTRQIAKTCKLDAPTTDDVRQELTLTALVAMENHKPDMSANLLTYVKAALNHGAAGVVRRIKAAAPVANADSILHLAEVENDYRRQADPNMPYEPLTISMGADLEQLAVCPPERDIELKLDIETAMEKLSPRQKTICKMLMAGHTQEEIVDATGFSIRTIRNEISKLKPVFYQFSKKS